MKVCFVTYWASVPDWDLDIRWRLFLITAVVFNSEVFTIVLDKVGREGDSLGSKFSEFFYFIWLLRVYNLFGRFWLFLMIFMGRTIKSYLWRKTGCWSFLLNNFVVIFVLSLAIKNWEYFSLVFLLFNLWEYHTFDVRREYLLLESNDRARCLGWCRNAHIRSDCHAFARVRCFV